MSKYKKPNWYPDQDVIAVKQGWVYTKNHNEVLSAIGYLDEKIANEEGGVTPMSDVVTSILNSMSIKFSGEVGASLDIDVNGEKSAKTLTDADIVVALSADLEVGHVIKVKQSLDGKSSNETQTTVKASDLPSSMTVVGVYNDNVLTVDVDVVNVKNGESVKLTVDGVDVDTKTIVDKKVTLTYSPVPTMTPGETEEDPEVPVYPESVTFEVSCIGLDAETLKETKTV